MMDDNTMPPTPPTPPPPAQPGIPMAPPPLPPLSYPQYAPAPKATSKMLVVLAWVAVIVPIPVLAQIAGVVMAIVHLNTREGLRRAAQAAIIVNVVVAAIWIVAIVANSHTAERDNGGTISQSGTIDSNDLKVGDCGKTPDNLKGIRDVDVVPCAEPHTFEVYSIYVPPAGSYPGSKSVEDTADQHCVDKFESYVGISFEKSEIDVIYMYPRSELSWDMNRSVQCLLVTDQPRTGSLKGSKK